jgi:catalase
MAHTVKDSIKTRKIAFLVDEGVNDDSVVNMQDMLLDQGAVVELIAPRLGTVTGENNTIIPVNKSLLTAASVFYDAVYVPGGANSVGSLAKDPEALHFLNEAFKHCKAIAADSDALPVLEATNFARKLPKAPTTDLKAVDEGLIINNDMAVLSKQFIAAVSKHRFWDREQERKVPA